MTEIPLNPPAAWFTPPSDMPRDAGCIVEANGRVFGYLCHWGSVLMDGSKDRWTPPRSRNGYSFAHTGDTLLDDGSIIKTANLGGDAGHAETGTGDLAATQAFYENTQTQLARVRYGEDEHGVWFAGSCWPTITELDMARLRASARSGHWAAVGDWRDMHSGRAGYELVGACLVNVPGLKYARADKAASGVISFNPVSIGEHMQTQIQIPTGVKFDRVAASGTVALEAEEAPVTDVEQAVGGVLLVEGSATEDGRLIQEGATEWREMPLALYASLANLPGHDSAHLVGRIDEVFRDADDPKQIHYRGVIFPSSADGVGQQVIDAIGNGMLTGVSIDGIVGPHDSYWDDEEVNVMSRIVIAGATLTPMPAISDASVTLLAAETLECCMDEDELVEDLVDEAVEDDTQSEDQWSALSEQVASVSDRLEFLISLVESQQLSARLRAAEAKINSLNAKN